MIQVFGLLALAIGFIILTTTKFNWHPFLSLLCATFFTAVFAGMPLEETTPFILQKFGQTIGSIGLLIISGTLIGVMLEKSGATLVIAEAILKRIPENKPNLALSAMGFFVSIPVFCDAAFVILSSLNKTLSLKTKTSLTALSIALATGLFAPHVLVPPTPGPIAAAANLQVSNLFWVIFAGITVSFPVVLSGYLFSTFLIKKMPFEPESSKPVTPQESSLAPRPGLTASLLPIVIPVFLMALAAISDLLFGKSLPQWIASSLYFLGNPTVALLIGMLLAFRLHAFVAGDKSFSGGVNKGLRDAAVILMITGIGGAFGGVISYLPLGSHLQDLNLTSWGLILPFLMAALLKTAQGSSTVAIITVSAIMWELLPALGLATESGKILTIMAIGCGAMTVSHANDSYFWVVSQFSGMSLSTAYKTITVASFIQGVVGILTVLLLSFFW